MSSLSHAENLILLADDEVMLRNLLRTVLEAEGYSVVVAADGHEALELFRRQPDSIDLLLSDVEMPGGGGLAAYQQISAERPGIRVLFMSGRKTGPLGLPRSLPFLAKPFGLETLRIRVKQVLTTPTAGGAPKVILVVDHNERRGERTRNILLDDGYAVVTAGNVEEAKAVADSVARIDLIVSGVVFPGLSGVHLAEHVEASEREISTLLISHFHPELLRGIPGFTQQPEFLQNPFTPEDLVSRVRQLLGTA